ncbi:AfsR/SARP family transcriptional regulator [Actinomadura oligospora]|uniref:AfsR/SARP family transcriptional regulator n=1 Tax=Actinomadura oligospora TaxID=111804 RepID=UPI0004B27A03|nr:BTAD domain-containing putative transcriptional regulator [Actinomadura oligospora]
MGDGPRFAVLGPVRGWRGDAELDLGAPQQRAMLAFLLLQEGRAAAAQTIVEALWGDRPPERARGAIRTYASRLRSAVEPDRARPAVLVTAGDGYRLVLPGEGLDATLFRTRLAAAERARASGELDAARRLVADALALWTGDPLDDLPGPFARAQRARLAEWRLVASQTRFELDLALGLHEEAVAELTVLAAEHPLREAFQRLLMLALHRSGRRAEAIEVFERSRSLLDAELGLDPDPDLVELRRLIAAGPTVFSAVAQLPSDLIDFTGRQERARELARLLSDGPTVAAVCGPVGVGTSALALHVAHLVRDVYPDGQFYADLRRSGPDAILLDFLRTLGVRAENVTDREERAALLRSALRGRRMLLVLDNAPDAASLRPLLPDGGECSVLVTCRARPEGIAHVIELDEFSEDEALAFFGRVAGHDRVAREPDAVAEAVALCGRLPLALRILAARLASRPGWTAGSLVRRLADERRRLAELKVGTLGVEAAFAREYARLDAGQARAFRLLAQRGRPSFSLDMAAELLKRPREEVEGTLAALVGFGLLTSPSPGRFRYPDLLHLYARHLP